MLLLEGSGGGRGASTDFGGPGGLSRRRSERPAIAERRAEANLDADAEPLLVQPIPLALGTPRSRNLRESVSRRSGREAEGGGLEIRRERGVPARRRGVLSRRALLCWSRG